jgi:selenide,water dikinase
MEHGADAGVFRLTPELAIVQSADFFPPHVSDPRIFGAIAAANALSDIYAMGARPVTVLNLLATPEKLPQAQLVAMLDGAREKVEEAGAVIAGGHTITSRTLMYGLSCTGVVHPDKLVKNTTAQVGDVLVLTKPIGTGIVIHAHATGDMDDEGLAYACSVMATLNRLAGEALVSHNAHASTDITGFGLIGHALDMLSLGEIGMEIDFAQVPLLPGVMKLAQRGNIPAGSRANAAYTDCHTEYEGCPEEVRLVLNDAQTSGGLLVALEPREAARLGPTLRSGGYRLPTAIIGRVTAEHPGNIKVLCQ